MAYNVSALLDKAKDMHRLSSDYKLALVMGVSHNSLASYRHGKTLPDARVIGKICELTGDDAALKRENATLAARVAYLERVGQFGSANAPTLAPPPRFSVSA